MKYLFFEKITYNSKLNIEEVYGILYEYIEENIGIYEETSKPFIGKIEGNTFSITKTDNSWSKSTQTQIDGIISENIDGSYIVVKMRPNTVFIFISLFFLGYFIKNIIYKENFYLSLISICFLLITELFSFNYQSKKLKKQLQEIFKANIITE